MYLEYGVLGNVLYDNKYGRVRFDASGIASEAKPGQFVMLKCWKENEPFLPRPFSINSIDRFKGTIDILYKIVGNGTIKLSELNVGDKAMILGPLGNGFVISDKAKSIAVVGRGIGAAPMLFLAEEAVKKNIDVYAFLSASKEEYIFDIKKYKNIGAKVYTMCDDTHCGGLVTDYLIEVLQDIRIDSVYVCGSRRLIKEVSKLKKVYGFSAYASLEEHMACGIGACKGCICTTKNEDNSTQYERVCKEGPVFPVERLVI